MVDTSVKILAFSICVTERCKGRNVSANFQDRFLLRTLFFLLEDPHEASLEILEPVQVLRVVGPEQDELAHVGVPLSLDVFAAQVTQLSNDDVDQDVQVVGVEQLMAVTILQEHNIEI